MISSDRIGLAIIILAAIVMTWAVWQVASLQSANDRSRWCTVWSLVERGTFQIDEIDADEKWSTIDKVRHRNSDSEPYHFYSSKPPLLSTAVAALYWLERNTLGYSLTEHTDFVSRLLLFVVNVLPMVLCLLSLRKTLRLIEVDGRSLWLLLTSAAFGSMLNPFLTTLNNHTPAAVSLVFCLSAMTRVCLSNGPRGRDYAIIGFTAALTCCFELPAALFGLLTFVFVVKRDWRKTAACYVPAAIVPLAAFFVTNIICTGGIKPFYAYYGTDKYVYVHEGIPSYWTTPQGIDANAESPAVYLFHCLLGHHGIFSISPIFLLTIVGWHLTFRRKHYLKLLPIQLMGASLSLIVLTFYLTRTANYNYGGNSAALRWMLWMTPFWWYGMIPAVQKLAASRRGVALVVLLLAVSIYSSAYSLQQPWKPGWIFDRMQTAGLIDYHTKVPPFSPARYSLIAKLPDAPGMVGQWTQSVGPRQTLQITSAAAISIDNGEAIPLRLNLQFLESQTVKTATLVILVESFRNGDDISQWLRTARFASEAAVFEQPGTAVDRVSQAANLTAAPVWVLDLLRGLPSSRAFNAASQRYLKYTRSDGEKWALKCDRGASRVAFEDPEFGQCWQRCDVYFCDELPFGMAQWKITTTSVATREVVRSELWTCRNLP